MRRKGLWVIVHVSTVFFFSSDARYEHGCCSKRRPRCIWAQGAHFDQSTINGEARRPAAADWPGNHWVRGRAAVSGGCRARAQPWRPYHAGQDRGRRWPLSPALTCKKPRQARARRPGVRPRPGQKLDVPVSREGTQGGPDAEYAKGQRTHGAQFKFEARVAGRTTLGCGPTPGHPPTRSPHPPMTAFQNCADKRGSPIHLRQSSASW